MELTRRTRSRALGRRTTTFVVAALIGIAFAGSGLLTPLYALYQKSFGFSEVTLTLIYSAYVLGNVAALLFLGRLSDRVGCRITGAASVVAGLISVLLFLFASGTVSLVLGRIMSGVAVGVASGTGTAWLADLEDDKGRATLVAAAANAFGFAIGPLVAGVLAQYGTDPLRTPYYAYAPGLLATGIAIALTSEPRRIAAAGFTVEWFRPRVGVPRECIGAFVAPAVAAFGVFAVVGFYAALIPRILKQSLHLSGPIFGGLVVFELAAAAGIVTLLARKVESRTAMLTALVALLPCIVLLLFAQALQSEAMLLIATALGGVCWGLGIRGSLQVVNEIAPEDRRAEVASTYYIAGFIGNSIPVIGVGLIGAAFTPIVASAAFGVVVAAFAIAAIAVGLRYGGREAA